ncbi:hypothetical protein AB4305_33380 [Nocardia sp. 2YAB30]|uniref:hypothetical protein n=1 Tax=Nocardia sp. 2YAB30 TaxID=3233022 RepID=UPI003F9CDD43
MQRLGVVHYDPFEVVLCVVFGASALLQFFHGAPPGSTAATLPPGFRLVWLVLMTAGCAFTLGGVLSRWVWGYLVEQIGLMATGWSLVAYGAQVLLLQIQRHSLSPATALGGPLVIGLGVAFLWKRQQVWNDVKSLRASMREEAAWTASRSRRSSRRSC